MFGMNEPSHWNNNGFGFPEGIQWGIFFPTALL